jgi:hypothetical protein
MGEQIHFVELLKNTSKMVLGHDFRRPDTMSSTTLNALAVDSTTIPERR